MSNRRNLVASAVCMMAAWSTQAAGALLLDFGNDTDDVVRLLRLSPSGGIFAEIENAPSGQCGILSLDPDGVANTAFDQDGRLGLNTCPPDFRVQSDGTLVLLESITSSVTPSIRVRSPSGALTLTSPELYPLDPNSNRRRAPRLLSLRADGTYLVGGFAKQCLSCAGWFVDRFNVDGSPDATLGGPVIIDHGGTTQVLQSIHPLPAGKMLLSGTNSGPAASSALAMRLNADGTPDSSFGANGKVQLAGEVALSALDSTGRLYLVTGQGRLARLLADGSLDGAYAGGSVQVGVQVSSMSIDDMDRAVLFGEGSNQGYVARFDTSGNPDTTFNGTGEVLVTFPRPLTTEGDAPCFGAVQSGSQLLLACSVEAEADAGLNPRNDVAIVRITSTGAQDPTFGAGQADPDSYPDPISFPDATAPYGTAWVQSAPQTIGGFTNPAIIDIGGGGPGQYSIGCTGTFSALPGVITPGQTVCLRQPASLQPGATSVATLFIGGRTATFTVIAGNTPADFVPDAFAFAAQSDVAVSTTVTSNAVTITGITGAATVTVANGSYSIGCGQTFITASRQITDGTSICVRHVAATAPGTTTSTQLTVGGVSATFSSTTIPADTAPDTFTFTDLTGVTAGALAVSNAVTISGINAAANVSVTGGEFSIGCNGTFTSTAGSIESGQSVCVRHSAAAAASTSVTTTLIIGGVSDGFTSTTAAASSGSGSSSGSNGGGGAVDRLMLSLLAALAIFAHRRDRRQTIKNRG